MDFAPPSSGRFKWVKITKTKKKKIKKQIKKAEEESKKDKEKELSNFDLDSLLDDAFT